MSTRQLLINDLSHQPDSLVTEVWHYLKFIESRHRMETLATTESPTANTQAKRQIPLATPEMLAQRKAALSGLRAAGGLQDVILNPLAWQREIRVDRESPDRE